MRSPTLPPAPGRPGGARLRPSWWRSPPALVELARARPRQSHRVRPLPPAPGLARSAAPASRPAAPARSRTSLAGATAPALAGARRRPWWGSPACAGAHLSGAHPSGAMADKRARTMVENMAGVDEDGTFYQKNLQCCSLRLFS
jgi:hypothetical protein